MIGRTISHYKILEKLGEGGMGVVYKARDTRLDRPVALKFLPAHLLGNEDVRKRFKREAKAAASLNHPNVCTVYEIDEAAGKSFISMELIEGESLDQKIAQGPLKLEEALSIAQQVAKGLECAHKRGIVHRDIKPENIMVGADGHVTVMDFGLAQLTEATRLTKTDETLGTVAYMSPEQTQGSGTDHRTDIWSLGVVLYEMVAGQPPFQGDYDKAVMYSILNEEHEPITALRAGLPMELEVLMGKALAKTPEERYQSAAELLVDLTSLKKKLGSDRSLAWQPTAGTDTRSSAGADAATVSPVERTPSSRIVLAVAVVMTLATAFLSLLHLGGRPAENRLVRFSFTPDSLSEWPARRAAVSPDGRRIAYASEGPAQLWVRDLDSEEPRPFDGTEGAQAPFWSPDSSSIGFFASGELKKIDADGGLPITLSEASGRAGGGSWSPDGETIAFAYGLGGTRLFSVPAEGGPRTDPFEGQAGFTPHFLPAEAAERALLYALPPSGPGPSDGGGLYLVRAAGGEPLQLTKQGTQPVYSSTGHILYQPAWNSGGIWALPFSLKSLEATGPAFPVAQGVGDPSIALDGTLVSADVEDNGLGRQLVWRDRAGQRLGTIGRPQARIFHPTLSPDGTKVAVSGFEDSSDEGDIWVHEVDRDVKRRLTFDAARDDLPAWSPDGREIVFRSARQGAGDLFVVGTGAAGDERPFVESEFREAESDWSPDGRFLIYQVHAEGGLVFNLRYLMRREDGAGFESAPFLERAVNDSNPRISPDGRFVAHNSRESGASRIYVRPFPKGRGVWQVSESGGNQPRWSADGRELYWVEGSTLMAAAVSTRSGFAVGEIKTLFEDPNLEGSNWQYDVAPDGRFVTVEDAAAGEQPEKRKPAIRIVQNWYEEFRDREAE